MVVITHKHHVIPKHMGGTDDPDNIIELSIQDHAEAHRMLYEQYGKWEDKLAWEGLAGIITKEELVYTLQRYEKTPEHREKISNTLKGRKLSKETRQKMSLARKGKPHSAEWIRKISEANKGQVPWILGKTHSEETCRKISESNKGNKSSLGRVNSEETKLKMSIAAKKRWNK